VGEYAGDDQDINGLLLAKASVGLYMGDAMPPNPGEVGEYAGDEG